MTDVRRLKMKFHNRVGTAVPPQEGPISAFTCFNSHRAPPRYEAKLQLSAQEGSDACSTRYYRIVSASGASRAIYPRPGLV